jgi:hypothetical protein
MAGLSARIGGIWRADHGGGRIAGHVAPEDPGHWYSIEVAARDRHGAEDGDPVIVEVTKRPQGENPAHGRIEVLDRRYMSKYMAREYVTIRGEERNGRSIWRETSVGPMDVKSIIARAVRLKDGTVSLSGAAWTDGVPLRRVELKIDDGGWLGVRLDEKQRSKYSWTFWSYDWRNPAPGDHTVVSRAVDAEGRSQPAAER